MFPTYILAGGKSSRFGSDKGRQLVDGVTLIERLYRIFSSQELNRIFLVAGSKETYSDLQIPTILDSIPNLGPVSGVATALEHRERHGDCIEGKAGSDWCLIVTCDLLEWHPAWVDRLSEGMSTAVDMAVSGKSSQKLPKAACFCKQESTNCDLHRLFWDPFPGLFHGSALPEALRIRDSQRPSMQDLLNSPSMNSAPISQKDLPKIRSANTKEEFDYWLRNCPGLTSSFQHPNA